MRLSLVIYPTRPKTEFGGPPISSAIGLMCLRAPCATSVRARSYLRSCQSSPTQRALPLRVLSEMLLDRKVEALIVVANWVFVNIDVSGDLEKNNIPTAMI